MLSQIHFVPPVPTLLAKEFGLLAGVDLSMIRTSGSEEQIRRLRTGEVDIAVTAIDNLFAWTQRCDDLRLVAQVERTTSLQLYGKQGLSQLTDLEGGLLAVDALDNGFALVVKHLLGAQGVTVEYVEVGGVSERLDALVSGAVSGTLLGPPFSQAAERAGLNCLLDVNEKIPTFPGQGLIARKEVAMGSECQTYLGALAEAVERSQVMSDSEGIEVLERAGFSKGAAAAWESRPKSLDVNLDGLDLLTSIRRELGALPDSINLHALHDDRPLLEAIAQNHEA